jgi:hypothetical protein
MSEPAELSGSLTDYGHELLQRVYFEDTDFSGASTMRATCTSWSGDGRITSGYSE